MEENIAVDFEEFYPEPFNRCYEFHCYPSAEGLSVYFSDATARRQAEEAMRHSEEKYRGLREACPDSVVMTDFQGKRTFSLPGSTGPGRPAGVGSIRRPQRLRLS